MTRTSAVANCIYTFSSYAQLEGRFLLQGMGAKGGKKSNDTWRGIVDTLAYITGISRGSSSIRGRSQIRHVAVAGKSCGCESNYKSALAE